MAETLRADEGALRERGDWRLLGVFVVAMLALYGFYGWLFYRLFDLFF